jgi:hypothetical protein
MGMSPLDAPLADSAERRIRLLAANEFKIRALRQKAVKAGSGDDFIVLILDLNDALARNVFAASGEGAAGERIGQPMRPGDTLQLVGMDWRTAREAGLFSPNNIAVLDRCRPGEIRVALLSEGRTMVAIMPGDRKLEDFAPAVMIQTEEDRKLGLAIPDDVLDAADRSRTRQT